MKRCVERKWGIRVFVVSLLWGVSGNQQAAYGSLVGCPFSGSLSRGVRMGLGLRNFVQELHHLENPSHENSKNLPIAVQYLEKGGLFSKKSESNSETVDRTANVILLVIDYIERLKARTRNGEKFSLSIEFKEISELVSLLKKQTNAIYPSDVIQRLNEIQDPRCRFIAELIKLLLGFSSKMSLLIEQTRTYMNVKQMDYLQIETENKWNALWNRYGSDLRSDNKPPKNLDNSSNLPLILKVNS